MAISVVNLGKRIRSQREKKGLCQLDLARMLQVSAQAVSKWERGENAPDISYFLELAKILGVTVDWLLGRSDADDDTFTATIFCTALNGYALRSAQLAPRDVADWANAFFHPITEAVLRCEGVPIKYVGDGFLAFFAGRDHAQRGLDALLQCHKICNNPDLVVTLHSGEIYLGSIGAGDYATPDIIGESVNTAFMVRNWVANNTASHMALTAPVYELLGERGESFSKYTASVEGLESSIDIYELAHD
jgi:class 3 adenylate cyclase